VGIAACTRQKVPDNGEIYRSPRTMCPHYGTCILPPIWYLEFGGGFMTFEEI